MAQDKLTKLDAFAVVEKAEPSLPLPGDSDAAKSNDDAVPRSFPPLLPPPLPGAASGKAEIVNGVPDESQGPPKPSKRAPQVPKTATKPAKDAPSSKGRPTKSESSLGPPPLPDGKTEATPVKKVPDQEPAAETPHERRTARRRPAGPVRERVAANDDGPSIGGLIYALQQKPSSTPFKYAAIASAIWGAIGFAFGIIAISSNAEKLGFFGILSQPTTFLMVAAVVVPIAVIWFLALLAWRAEELRLRSSTMTEVAVRLAEPDRMAEESVASLGQAVRRQVSFMNDAVSRALGRAGELEALVHNEVASLERSYEENEGKIRNLINELTGERHALVNTSDRVSGTLRELGTEIPTLIEKLSDQQVKLAQIVQGAGQNLTALESSLGTAVGSLETSLGERSSQLQNVLENYTTGLATAVGNRTEQMQIAFDAQMETLDTSLGNRTENLQTVFEEYARALDTTLTNRTEALDFQLIERTKSLDAAFTERLRSFDESIMRSTAAIDTAITERADSLTNALDSHAHTFKETIGKQATDLDEALMLGINSVRRSSENITRQSIKAMEGLANQSEVLRNVSENLLGQINNVTGRFEDQGQHILKAASALENANFKIDSTLQKRHTDLSKTLDRLSNKADEFGDFVEGYSSSIEGSLTQAGMKARSEIEQMRQQTATESERALADLKNRVASVSSQMTNELGSLTNQFTSTSEEMRQHAERATAQIAAEQERLRKQMEQLPVTSQENAETMRRALQDQLKALDQLSQLTARTAQQRDVRQPAPAGHLAPPPSKTPPPSNAPPAGAVQKTRALTSLSSSLSQEIGNRQRRSRPTQGGGDDRENWSLGDLLARASLDDDAPPQPTAAPPTPARAPSRPPSAPAPSTAQRHQAPAAPAQPAARPTATTASGTARRQQQPAPKYNLNLRAIAHALDSASAAAIWTRLRAGQRGVMVRSIYGEDGRATFDELSQRCRADPDLMRTIMQYVTDFERIISESDERDPTGRLTHSHMISDTGRVYLFLAHSAGRLG